MPKKEPRYHAEITINTPDREELAFSGKTTDVNGLATAMCQLYPDCTSMVITLVVNKMEQSNAEA